MNFLNKNKRKCIFFLLFFFLFSLSAPIKSEAFFGSFIEWVKAQMRAHGILRVDKEPLDVAVKALEIIEVFTTLPAYFASSGPTISSEDIVVIPEREDLSEEKILKPEEGIKDRYIKITREPLSGEEFKKLIKEERAKEIEEKGASADVWLLKTQGKILLEYIEKLVWEETSDDTAPTTAPSSVGPKDELTLGSEILGGFVLNQILSTPNPYSIIQSGTTSGDKTKREQYIEEMCGVDVPFYYWDNTYPFVLNTITLSGINENDRQRLIAEYASAIEEREIAYIAMMIAKYELESGEEVTSDDIGIGTSKEIVDGVVTGNVPVKGANDGTFSLKTASNNKILGYDDENYGEPPPGADPKAGSDTAYPQIVAALIKLMPSYMDFTLSLAKEYEIQADIRRLMMSIAFAHATKTELKLNDSMRNIERNIDVINRNVKIR